MGEQGSLKCPASRKLRLGREPLQTPGNSKGSSSSRHQSQGLGCSSLCPSWLLELVPTAHCLLAGCTSAASTRAGEQESITGLAKAGLFQGWHVAPAPAAAEHVAQHWRLGADVPLAHVEQAKEPLESHGMKVLVNQGHSSAPLASCAIYSVLGAHPGEVQPLGCRL